MPVIGNENTVIAIGLPINLELQGRLQCCYAEQRIAILQGFPSLERDECYQQSTDSGHPQQPTDCHWKRSFTEGMCVLLCFWWPSQGQYYEMLSYRRAAMEGQWHNRDRPDYHHTHHTGQHRCRLAWDMMGDPQKPSPPLCFDEDSTQLLYHGKLCACWDPAKSSVLRRLIPHDG